MTEEEMTARYKGRRCLVLPWYPGQTTWIGRIGHCYWRRDKGDGNYHWWFQVFEDKTEWRILRQDEIQVD